MKSLKMSSPLVNNIAFCVAILISLSLIALSYLVAPSNANSDSPATPITGYAWSGGGTGSTPETSGGIGWISLNCSDAGTCGTVSYGLSVASDGTISGYAWSESVGWVSANSSDLSGCPSGTCSARLTSGSLSGWLRALSGGSAESGGWDGWISLNGTAAGSPYGPTLSNSAFSDYGWGGDILGWIDFSYAHSGYQQCIAAYSCSGQAVTYTDQNCQASTITTCVSPAFCSPGSSTCLYPTPTFNSSGSGIGALSGHLQARPQIVSKGATAIVAWDVSNVASCSVSGTNGDGWSGLTGSHTTSAINQQVTYTLTCTKLDSTTMVETTTVNLTPVFQER